MFPDNYTILVVGDPSAGMFEFCCYLGATYLRSDENLVFVEADSSPARVRQQIREFHADPLKHEADGSFVLLDCSSPRSDLPAKRGSVVGCDISDLEGLLEHVNEGIETVGGSPVRVLFNSLTPLYMYHGPEDVAGFFTELSANVKLTGILTCTIHHKILGTEQIEPLIPLADSVMDMMVDEHYKRFVRIRHMRGANVAPKWVPFEFIRVEEPSGGTLLSWDR